MTPQTRTSLRELQNLDREIATVRSTTESFDPLLEEVDAPVLRLEQEVRTLEKRLTEIKVEENRIELTIEERRVRAEKLDERMEAVRNVREEAAVHAELEMVRRALESEEQEALSLLDQIRRLEERYGEQEAAYQEALAEVGPRREELVKEQQATKNKLEALQSEREAFAAAIDPEERRIYDSIMAGSRDVALAELTQDGACGNCYNMVPLQIQNQIRHTDTMFRCEGCGVILTPESAEGLVRAQEEGERIERALKASTDQRDLERAAVSEAEALEEAEEAAAEAHEDAEKVAEDAEKVAEDAEKVAAEAHEDAEKAAAEEAVGRVLGIEEAGVGGRAGDEVDAGEVSTKPSIFADMISDVPPADEPPADEPPADEPPADEPPAEEVAGEVVAADEVASPSDEPVAEDAAPAESDAAEVADAEADVEVEVEAEIEVEPEVEAEIEVEPEVEAVAEEESGAEEAEPQEKPTADA